MIDRSKWFNGFIAAILVVAAFYIGKSCNCGHKQDIRWIPIKTTTTVKIHEVDTFISYQPKPYKVEKHDTLEIEGEPVIKYLPLDSFPPSVRSMLQEYANRKFYSDSFAVRYGKIFIDDTVQYNKLKGQGIRTNLSIPEITNTITIAQQPRTTMYVGLGLIGNKTNPLFMGEVNAGLLLKNRKYYGIGALLDKNGTIYYEGKMMIPITFRK